MSMKLMVQAMQTKVGNHGRKLVLIKLADNANDEGECFPSYQTIADACEMSRRSVITHIADLEAMGFLTKEERKRGSAYNINSSNIYRLNLSGENFAPLQKKQIHGGENSALGSENFALGSENSALGSGEKFALGSENSAPITYQLTSNVSESVNEQVNETCASDKSPAGDRDKKQKTKTVKKQTKSNPKPINIPFEDFWNAYDKKVGKIESLKKKWEKLTNKDRAAVMQHIKMYVISTPDKQFRKNPETYLNQKAWNNEIIGLKHDLVTGNFSGYAKLSDMPELDINKRVAERAKQRRLEAAKVVEVEEFELAQPLPNFSIQ